MNGHVDHSWSGDSLRERKNTQHGELEEHGEQENNAGSEGASREKELRKEKKTIGKTPDGSGE